MYYFAAARRGEEETGGGEESQGREGRITHSERINEKPRRNPGLFFGHWKVMRSNSFKVSPIKNAFVAEKRLTRMDQIKNLVLSCVIRFFSLAPRQGDLGEVRTLSFAF